MAKGYDAFISYSHAADAPLAAALERGLERLARPWNRLRAMSVFRDENDLTLNPDLWGMISERLDRSSHLVLLMCPESARSPWVNKEVAHWCDSHGVDRVLMVWTDGELEWDDAAGDFAAGSSALAGAIRQRFAHEPLYLDLRWARGAPDLTLALAPIQVSGCACRGADPQHGTWRPRGGGPAAAPARQAARACGSGSSSHPGDRRDDRWRPRRAQRQCCRRARAREAVARQLGLAALDLPASEIDRALLMSLASAHLADDDDPDRFQAAQVLIGRYSRLESLLPLGESNDLVNVRDLAVVDDGSIVAVAGRADGTTALASWRPGSPDVDVAALPPDAGADVALAPAGVVVVSGGSGDSVRRTPAGELAVLPGAVVAVDEQSGVAWLTTDSQHLSLVRLGDGAVLASIEAADPIVDLRGSHAVALVGNQLMLYDTVTGVVVATANDVPRVTTIAVAADGATVLAVADDGTLRRWVADGDSLIATNTVEPPKSVGAMQHVVVSRRRPASTGRGIRWNGRDRPGDRRSGGVAGWRHDRRRARSVGALRGDRR